MTDTPTALRELADLIEQHPELEPGSVEAVVYCNRDEFAGRVRALGGTRRKVDNGVTVSVVRDLSEKVQVRVASWREETCTRRVVGTETVEVPDPDAPKLTVEREIVEWDCSPILREA